MAVINNKMALLCRDPHAGNNYSRTLFWDIANPTGLLDEAIIPMGGPQIIINFGEVLWAICAVGGTLQTFRFQDKLPIPVHTLYNIATETSTQAIVPDATKFIKDNAFYFGLWKTDKSGLYAIGQVDPGKPYALVLAKRFGNAAVSSITRGGTGNLTATVTTATPHGLVAGDDIIVTGASNTGYNGAYRVVTAATTTTLTYTMTSDPGGNETTSPSITTKSYKNHKPYAAIVSGPNWWAAYDDSGTANQSKCEAQTQNRSSNAVYETIWIDLNSIETLKSWAGFLLGTKILPANCQIIVDAKVDNAASYDTNSIKTLTPSNDQTETGTTADTFWYREWTSVYGRMVRIRLRFISSSTTKATVYFLSFLSRLGNTI